MKTARLGIAGPHFSNLTRLLSIRALLAALLLASPIVVCAQVSLNLSVNLAPPVLPVYEQPPLPEEGYLWTPGYWAWSEDGGYYWVPGTWILPPTPGYLWTPGYWAADGGRFLWHGGFWGPTVGFYGGVNYGFGYGGNGFQGGYWRGGHLYYNRAANNFGSVHITNVYNRRVVNITTTHVSFNGGSGGIRARPTPAQLAATRGPHVEATEAQRQHIDAARGDASLHFNVNHGHPAIAATDRPGDLHGSHVVAAHGGVAPREGAPSREAPEASPGRPARASREASPTRESPAQREPPTPREAPAARAAPPAREQPPRAQPSHEQPSREQPSREQPPHQQPSREQRPPPPPHEQQHPDEHDHH